MSGTAVVRWWGTAWLAVACLFSAVPAQAGSALVDLLDGESLEQVEATTIVASERALELLLVQAVRERITAGALGYGTAVPVIVVAGDPGPSLAAGRQLPIGELLQLVLLGRSRSAIATLAAAVGPGWERARLRLRHAAARLDLSATTIPDTWPADALGVVHPREAPTGGRKSALGSNVSPPVAPARISVRGLARIAGAVAGDAEVRKRLALDGAPIADGAVIVRATDPLIALVPVAAGEEARTASGAPPDVEPRTAIAIGARDGLELLAVATGADASTNVWRLLERGFDRYRRVELVHAGQPVGGELHVRGGVVAQLTAVAAQPFAVTVSRSGAAVLRAWWQLPKGVAAPIEFNQPLGELVFEQAGRIIGAVPLVAPTSVAPNGWLDTARR